MCLNNVSVSPYHNNISDALAKYRKVDILFLSGHNFAKYYFAKYYYLPSQS